MKEKIQHLYALGSLKHVQKVHQRPPPPPSRKEVNKTRSCPKFQISPIFSRDMHFEEKCQDTENVPDKISYLIRSSKPSLRLIISLKQRQKYVHFTEICEKYNTFPIHYFSVRYRLKTSLQTFLGMWVSG